jgi:group I intron endonuclease
MGHIYLITNTITNEKYVGQTIHSVEHRFHDHITKSIKKSPDRKLYKNMLQYGVENFKVEELETCDNALLNEREIAWITKLDTFKNGLNSTPGGQAKFCTTADEEDIVNMYLQNPDYTPITKKYNLSRWVIKYILSEHNIQTRPSSTVLLDKFGSKAMRLDSNTKEVLEEYPSQMEAARWLKNQGLCNIADLRKAASHIQRASKMGIKMGGYFWQIETPQQYGIKNLEEIVSRDEFKVMIRNASFAQLAILFEVSDTTISRWCRRFGLPDKKSLIKQYTDEEWEMV